jgi:hypothetical protein
VSWPAPQPGQVIRYSYLWHDEFHRGLEEGRKDRPCAVILALTRDDGETQVVVLPITHTPPFNPAHAVEMPAATKQRLGLDDLPSFIVLTEANRFLWPGPDLRPFQTEADSSVFYGLLPRRLFLEVRDRFVQLARAGRAGFVPRSE